jgi:TIR domain
VVNSSESVNDSQYTYDAFVSYSTQDEEWVRGELLQCLERNNLRVCIDFRDFRPGYSNIDEINRAIRESRKMLLVLTPRYLSSQWTTHERQTVQNLDPMNRRVRLIPILKEKCELPQEINHLIYVDLTQPNSEMGWNRLLQAISGSTSPPTSFPSPKREGINPFIYGNPVPPEKFYGRRREIMEVKSRIGTGQSINIVGLRRIGKSSLLKYIQARPEEFFSSEQQPLIVPLDLTDDRFHSPDGIVEGLRRGIGRRLGKEPWKVEENGDAWAVQDGLEALRDRHIPLIIMLDEFEAIASRLDQFQGWGDDWRSKASTQGCLLAI